MDESLIEELLNEPEGPALDFKSQQYPWVTATEDQKSELLKDILAFTNSWRRSDAYILIGVREVHGGRHVVIGEENHPFDDAHLQQFVNEKTNQQVHFSYQVCRFEGKQMGVIRIPKQKRPRYAQKDYGKVVKSTVYFRRGSSLRVGTPEEIAKMGADDETENRLAAPELELVLADPIQKLPLGTSARIAAVVYTEAWDSHPNCRPDGPAAGLYNQNYWRELAKYFYLRDGFDKFCFRVENRSGVLARSVKVQVQARSTCGLRVVDCQEASRQLPTTTNIQLYRVPDVVLQPSVTLHPTGWTLTANVGDVQPKETVLSQSFLMGPTQNGELLFSAKVFGDNLPDPHVQNFRVIAEIKVVEPVLNDFEQRARDIERGYPEGNPFTRIESLKPW